MTQTQLNNYALSLQCCLAEKASCLAESQMIGNANNKERVKFIMASIYWRIIRQHDLNETCLTNDELCQIVRFTKNYCNDKCNC